MVQDMIGVELRLQPEPAKIIKIQWHAPPPTKIKMNTDGSSFGNPGIGGAACIFRDSNGNFLIAANEPLLYTSNYAAEALAVRMGLQIAIKMDYNNLIVELDSKALADAIADKGHITVSVYNENIVQDIQRLLQKIQIYEVQWIYREGNVVADMIAKDAALTARRAKEGHQITRQKQWLEVDDINSSLGSIWITPPFFIRGQLAEDNKAVLTCLQAPHAQDYLYTLPIAGLRQTMDAREYRAVLSYRLLVPMLIGGQVCHGCNKSVMDEMGDHAVHCRYDPGLKHRHDIVRDGLADILRRVGIAARKEAPVSLSKEGYDRILRPADVLIYNWTQGRHTCVDLSGCSPLVSLDRNGFDVGNAMRILVKNKYVKHEEACHCAGYEFVPFGFTTFGGLNEEAVGLMERVERIAHQHLLGYKSI